MVSVLGEAHGERNAPLAEALRHASAGGGSEPAPSIQLDLAGIFPKGDDLRGVEGADLGTVNDGGGGVVLADLLDL